MTLERDPYQGVARDYDGLGWDWYAATYGPRLTRLLHQGGYGKGRVLDAGCGTGTLALALAGEGFQVTGLDLSPAMLEVARGKDRSEAVRWVEGDITALDLGHAFDAVVCVADILNHVEGLDRWDRAFRGFARHLRPGGGLVFDAMTCLGLERLDGVTVQDRQDRSLIVTTVYERVSRRSTVKVTSFTPAAGSPLYRRSCATLTEWGQPVEHILDRLGAAGFGPALRPWSKEADPECEDRLAVFTVRP